MLKNMFKKVFFFCFKMKRFSTHAKMLHWVHYTTLFGLLPIVMRFILSLSDSTGTISLFVMSDIVFFGIMLNAAAIYNVSTTENIPGVQLSIVAFAFFRTIILVGLYTAALYPNNPLFLWSAVLLLTFLSFVASFLAIDSIRLRRRQDDFDRANSIEALPFTWREKYHNVVDKLWLLEEHDRIRYVEKLDEVLIEMQKKLAEKQFKLLEQEQDESGHFS